MYYLPFRDIYMILNTEIKHQQEIFYWNFQWRRIISGQFDMAADALIFASPRHQVPINNVNYFRDFESWNTEIICTAVRWQ